MATSPIILELHEYPEQFQIVAEKLGNEAACSLLWNIPGFQIRNIPYRAQKKLITQEIMQSYDGNNALSLAVKHNLQHSEVLQIIKCNTTPKFNPKCNSFLECVADRCGDKIATELIRHFAGHALCIPRSGHNIIIRKLIAKDHNGTNAVALAVKYSIAISTVYRIITEDMKKRQNKALQTSLFD